MYMAQIYIYTYIVMSGLLGVFHEDACNAPSANLKCTACIGNTFAFF